jgi:predicted ATPase/DNA-binding CsgD family transcriptional regulator
MESLLTPLVGREFEMAALRDLVLDPSARLLTLTGPVGVGKSRLAVALAQEVSGYFADGSQYVDLAAVDASADLAEIILDASGFTGHGDAVAEAAPPARLADHLRDRTWLLVLDHGEHMMDVMSPLLTALLIECPQVHVLVATNEPLRIYGETLFRVGPLELPKPGEAQSLEALERTASASLFMLRARSARPGFQVTADKIFAIAELCNQLDGLPLAIELAARQLKLHSIYDLLTQLRGRIDVLRAHATDTLSRHNSMHDAIAWSCARLTEAERTLFIRLAVFVGGFRLGDAEICEPAGSCHDLLEVLVDKNLLMLTEQAWGELGFSFLQTTRAYALEELRRSSDTAEMQARHASRFFERVIEAEPHFDGPDRARLIAQFVLARDDLEAALCWFADSGDGTRMAALAAGLRPFWLASGQLCEGASWLQRAVTMGGAPAELRAKALDALGEIRVRQGNLRARDQLAAALQLYRELGDVRGTATCLHHLGMLARIEGSADAVVLYEQAIAAARQAGHTAGEAAALRDLAECRLLGGDLEQAGSLGQNALRLSRQIQDSHGAACACRVLAMVALEDGDEMRAGDLSREAIRLLNGTGDLPALARNLEMHATILVVRGMTGESWRRSTQLLAAAQAIYRQISYQPTQNLTPPPEQLLERARIRLGEDVFDATWTAGSTMSVHSAVAEALSPLPQFANAPDTEIPSPLTPREYEVAELVARGLTNREIARRLGIAEWTVVNHLRRVMRKLGCPSRVHVATWIAQRRHRKTAAAVHGTANS